MINGKTQPLIAIASNRGPFTFLEQENGTFMAQRGAGGLVTALGALAEEKEILWVAAAMSEGDRKWAAARDKNSGVVEGIHLHLITPGEEEYSKYYHSFSNPLLWFIQHQLWDYPRTPNITRDTWDAWENGYLKVNKQFAEAIAAHLDDVERPVLIFPQDYQLYLVPEFLRNMLGDQVQIQPFIHIPWPSPDAWSVLPRTMRNRIFSSLLNADRVGFQTRKDAFNFIQTCRFYLDEAKTGGARDEITYQGRTVQARAYPISINISKVSSIAAEEQTELQKSQLINFISDRELILRVDRIEPSKNILRGLKAYRLFLEEYPQYHGKVQMLGLLVPSRMEVDEYQDYLEEVMAETGMINALYSDSIWEPVRVIVGDNYRRAIAAMQLYSVLLVNPIADGMNLVAKEGVLVNQHDGVLILSEHAGSYDELGEHAISVSPYDIYGTAAAIYDALTMDIQERRKRADRMRQIVEHSGIQTWFDNQLKDAQG